MRKTLMATAVLLTTSAVAPTLYAQAQVVESEPLSTSPPPNRSGGSGAGAGDSNMQAEMYFRLQSLQQEVQELRGVVEEQANEIKRLKQQRMDDYLDLDKRIGELREQIGQGGGAATTGAGGASGSGGNASGGRESETKMYRNAYELLRDREIEQSIEAFNAYLDAYPQGNFAGNSHYWLGEIYLLNQDLESAQKWFEQLLREFPNDRKRADAQYKLGRVYHQQGKNEQAKQLLQDVASGNSDASRLARQYLEENF